MSQIDSAQKCLHVPRGYSVTGWTFGFGGYVATVSHSGNGDTMTTTVLITHADLATIRDDDAALGVLIRKRLRAGVQILRDGLRKEAKANR